MSSESIGVIGFTEVVLLVTGVLMMLAVPTGLVVYLLLHRRRSPAGSAGSGLNPPSGREAPTLEAE